MVPEAAQLQELGSSEARLRLEELQELDARQCVEASVRRGSPMGLPCELREARSS